MRQSPDVIVVHITTSTFTIICSLLPRTLTAYSVDMLVLMNLYIIPDISLTLAPAIQTSLQPFHNQARSHTFTLIDNLIFPLYSLFSLPYMCLGP